MALLRENVRVEDDDTQKLFKREERRREESARDRHDVVGCRRELQLCELLHPKTTLVGDGDEFVVVVESSSKSSSKSQRRRSFYDGRE